MNGARIDQCTIVGNSGWGVHANDCQCVITNSIVRGNASGMVTGDSRLSITHTDGDNILPGSNNIAVDPLFVDAANNDYSLQWDAHGRSPCIDAGSKSQLDADGTFADLGACPTQLAHRSYHMKAPNGERDKGWKWLSYPAVDNLTKDMDCISTMLGEIYNPSILCKALWKNYHDPYPSELYYSGGNWVNGDHRVQHHIGYKLDVDDEFTDEVVFRYSGFQLPATTIVNLEGNYAENWVGYFLDETAPVEEAFESVWEDLRSIKHQHWCLFNTGIGWLGTTGDKTLSFGDMVVVTCANDLSFQWSCTNDAEEYEAEETAYFAYEEKADYLPFYIDVDSTVASMEVAVLINNECMGATPVSDASEPVQINGYVLDENGEMIEGEYSFAVHYGERSAPQAVSDYRVLNAQGGVDPSSPQPYYHISLTEGAAPVPPEMSMRCYPNPFNPDTKVAYSVAEDSRVQVTVYNVRGQRVKRLVDAQHEPGRYEAVWRGRDSNGKPVSSGVYFCVFKSGDDTMTQKVLLLK